MSQHHMSNRKQHVAEYSD